MDLTLYCLQDLLPSLMKMNRNSQPFLFLSLKLKLKMKLKMKNLLGIRLTKDVTCNLTCNQGCIFYPTHNSDFRIFFPDIQGSPLWFLESTHYLSAPLPPLSLFSEEYTFLLVTGICSLICFRE